MKRLIPTAVPRTLAQLSEGEERITTGAGQFGDALSDAPRQGSASTMRGYRNCPTVRKPDRPKLTAKPLNNSAARNPLFATSLRGPQNCGVSIVFDA